MSDSFEELFKEDVEQSVDTSAALASIAPLVQRWKAVNEEVEATEKALKDVKERLRRLEYVDIPNAMAEVGLAEIKTADGLVVESKPFVDGSIDKSRYDEAIKWLEDNGYGDIVKAAMTLSLPKGEVSKAHDVANKIEELIGTRPVVKESVHSQTMKAFLRQCEEDGVVLPEELFRVYRGTVAKIKPIKNKM